GGVAAVRRAVLSNRQRHRAHHVSIEQRPRVGLELHNEVRTMRPNHARGCVKSVGALFVNEQKFDMAHFDDVSRWIRWSKNEFSHSLALQRTQLLRSWFRGGPHCAGSLTLAREAARPLWSIAPHSL